MPHDVTMPQLGMAQDAGKIVSWLKSPGDAVSKGDALFEVETDKATMEVEAQSDGFLTNVTASEGDDVPVGAVIARISDTAEDDQSRDEPPEDAAADDDASEESALPEGREVKMPQLGMAQDTGVLVSWLKSPGDPVDADDVLFEVETDKSTMEVNAGIDGFLAARLAEGGDEVPVGETVAIIASEKPERTISRSMKKAAPPADAALAADTEADESTAPPKADRPRKAAAPERSRAADGRILASPKARRLALEQGLDLGRLVKAGHPQPYHVRDLDVLREMPGEETAQGGGPAVRTLTADVPADNLTDFLRWTAASDDLQDTDAVLAGLAGAGLAPPVTVGVSRFGAQRCFAVPADRRLSAIEETDEEPDVVLRDLRASPIRALNMGAEAVPVLTLTAHDAGLSVTLECAASAMEADAAISLLTEFAGRLENPLRHLL